MEKKVEEIINNTKNETVNDLLTLFNSKIGEPRVVKPYEWTYKLELHDIVQPDTVSGSSYPLIVCDKDTLLFTFNGKSVFYDENLSKVYISVPSNCKDMCIFRIEDRTFLVTLDQSNKLQQCEIKDGVVQQEKLIISRNVLQLFKYHETVYFVSFKKDIYNFNTLLMDDSLIRPKIIVPQIQVKYTVDFFPTKFGIFIKQDGKLLAEDGTKLSIKGDGIVEIDNFFIVYKKIEEGLRLSLLSSDKVIKNEIVIQNESQNIKIHSLGDLVVVRSGVLLYFIQVHNSEIVIGHELKYEKYPASVAFRKENGIVKIFNLFTNEQKISQKEKFELTGISLEEDLPSPCENSKVYDPKRSNLKESDEKILQFLEKEIVEKLFKKFEEKFEEREASERKRQNELLDKISEQLNSSLVKVVQKVIKNEMEIVHKKLLHAIEKPFAEEANCRTVDEGKILKFTKDIICETLLPVIEASMDEMRIQVINEVNKMNNSEHLQDIKRHLSTLSVANSSMSEIATLLLQNKVEECAVKVIEGGDLEVEEFLRIVEVSSLVDISSRNLLGLLEKILLYSYSNSKGDEIIRCILSDIDPNSLSDIELDSFQIVLSQLRDSEIIERPGNGNILVLCDYFTGQIPKILRKRKRNIKK
ncbi:hypothetical protein NGRA_1409 [Nosema granulosis]|uniref:Uncharacterized protein n=1 Tax=Nosema granulosis TaxID=83296 RepID=A0A9P6H033_9MICR|nr:hypothetical protein NGRA_1409 [Nosema granulosis]